MTTNWLSNPYAAMDIASRRSAGAPEIFSIRMGLFGSTILRLFDMGILASRSRRDAEVQNYQRSHSGWMKIIFRMKYGTFNSRLVTRETASKHKFTIKMCGNAALLT